jgi:drug/metabolite transporter (DMT)-like permease
MVWSVLMGTIMLLPLLSPSLISEAAALSLGGWFFVLYLAIFSSVVGYLIFYTLINRESVTRLSIQLYLVPVISVTGGILLLHESVTLSMVVGGLFLLLSVTLVTVMGRSKNRVDHNQQVTN